MAIKVSGFAFRKIYDAVARRFYDDVDKFFEIDSRRTIEERYVQAFWQPNVIIKNQKSGRHEVKKIDILLKN